MTDSSETKLIEALKKVEAYGDVAPAHVHDPTAMIMRQIAERSSLMRWNDVKSPLRVNPHRAQADHRTQTNSWPHSSISCAGR